MPTRDGSPAGEDHPQDVFDARTWMTRAYQAALYAKDARTQLGAALSDGHGGWLNACDAWPYRTKHRSDRPLIHAETGVILAAAHSGCRTAGETLVCCYGPCPRCASCIINAGIVRLVRHEIVEYTSRPMWRTAVEAGDAILREAGVEIVKYRKRLGDPSLAVRCGGVLFEP